MAITSNAISHINALEKIASSYIDGLILEDDLIFNDKFTDNLKKCLDNLPTEWDMVFLSEGCDIHPPDITVDKTLYKYDSTRCASCYLVSNKAAKKIINTIIPIKVAIDHQYNIEIKRHNLNVYLLEPTIAYEGSKFNVYKSSV